MTTRPRQIRHPGPPAAARITALPCRAVPLRLTLRAGQSLAAAVPAAMAQAGFAHGYLRLDGARFAPLSFVTPAPATGDGHAAWYSATHRHLAAQVRYGGLHLGQRDGAPFVHCHGIWASDLPDTGHMLCEGSILAQDQVVTGWGLAGAGLVASPDVETGFTLFQPQATDTAASPDACLITLRPNQDITTALADFAREQGVRAARVEGIGSLIGTAFSDSRTIPSYATEFLIVRGRISTGEVALEGVSTGFDGQGRLGRLAPALNAICVTAEILLLVDPGG